MYVHDVISKVIGTSIGLRQAMEPENSIKRVLASNQVYVGAPTQVPAHME
jgi:hypothetical protein